MEGYETDKTFLRAKLYFNNGVYNKAYEQFIVILEASENSSTILLGIPQESAMHLFIAAMLTATEKLKVALEQVEKHCDDITARVYRQMALIYSNNENSDSDVNIGPDKLAFPVISSLLDKVLRSRDYILFEKLLKIYNCMDSKAVLINLAEIYYQNGLYKMASTQVLRSIRDLEYLDPLGIEILWKTKNII
jgi:tetratricopeptide (TPR) repeat protein